MTRKDLHTVLSGKMYRTTIQELIDWTLLSKRNFKMIMECFNVAEDKIDQRAAWVMSEVLLQRPGWVTPYWDCMLEAIQNDKRHPAVRRNVFRAWQEMRLPDEVLGPALECIFPVVRDPQQDIAVRAFGLTILTNACLSYPDLKAEVVLVIEDMLPYASSGLKNRCLKMLKKIST